MEMGHHWRFGFLLGVAMTTAGVGCMLNQADEEVGDDGAEINEGSGDVSQVLKSTILLDTGCSAVKVGDNHLLTAARCVADNKAFASGKTITFRLASGATQSPPNPSMRDAGGNDNSGTTTTTTSGKKATIDLVKSNPSWTSDCSDGTCALGSVAAGQANDIAVIVVEDGLDGIPTLKVDLDEVGQNDPVLAVGSGCVRIDGTPSTVKTIKTVAVAPSSVNHKGSVYQDAPEKVGGLNGAYVVTPGSDWKGQDGPSLCLSDIGAPLFRGNAAVVVGVTSNYTTFDTDRLVAATVEHTRVDSKSKMGSWLGAIKGLETTHSCSDTSSGCTNHGKFDGGVPNAKSPGDAGEDALAPPPKKDDDTKTSPPSDTSDVPTGSHSGDDKGADQKQSGDDDDDDKNSKDAKSADAGAKKTEKKKDNGCSTAAPGSSMPRKGGSPLPGFAIVLGITISLASLRRRRGARTVNRE
jgi:hypothetical protein